MNTRLKAWYIAVVITMPALAVHAASFDCDKAASRAEHLICTDESLSKLDSDLGDAFSEAIHNAANQELLIHSQRAWLKARNRCSDTLCIKQAYSDRLADLKHIRLAEWKTYTDAELKISFQYLDNRQIKKRCPYRADEQCVALVDKKMNANDYIVAFKVVNGPLEKVAAAEAGFEYKNGKWIATFGMGSNDAERFTGPGWNGMRATVPCGISDPDTRYHAAAGECFWAVLSNGARSVVVNTPGAGSAIDKDTMRSIESLKFIH